MNVPEAMRQEGLCVARCREPAPQPRGDILGSLSRAAKRGSQEESQHGPGLINPPEAALKSCLGSGLQVNLPISSQPP